jgi:amidase
LNPHALEQARAFDAERRAGRVRGRMHGIPILVKDNIDVAGLVTSAGSVALGDHRAKNDAPVIARLRAAGVVILGKTNLSEWANMRSDHSISGWSSLGGQTRNPYVLDRTACGSSSGTAAAISAGLAVAGLGTETDGSIMCPSSVTGLVGMKATVGVFSTAGVVPISTSQDVVGPMARTVADAAAMFGAMHPPPSKRGGAIDYVRSIKGYKIRGLRVGVIRPAFGFHRDVERVMESTIKALEAAGATVGDAPFPTLGRWFRPELEVLLYEFGPALNAYLEATDAPLKSLAAVIDYNIEHASTVMPLFGQDLLIRARDKGPLTEQTYLDARATAVRLAGTDGIDAALAAGPFDVLLTSAVGPAWTIDPLNGDHFRGSGYGAAAVAGYPSITVPAGHAHGLPIGVVFMGPKHGGNLLLDVAFAFEQQTRARIEPTYKKTLGPVLSDRPNE